MANSTTRRTSAQAIILAALLGVCLSCSIPISNPSGASRLESLTANSSLPSTASTRTETTVSFNEGTNMAAARNAVTGDYVLSLQGTLFTLPATGGAATPLTDYFQDAREPQIAPNGKSVVYHGYANGTWDIFQLSLNTRQITPLTGDEFDDREPTWSPDGKTIAFSSDRSGNYDLWLLTISDGTLRQLTQSTQDDYSPSFSADGRRLFFTRRLQRTETELLSLQIDAPTDKTKDGANAVSIGHEAGTISGVSASPDANWVAYQLHSRDRSGSAQTELKLLSLTRPNSKPVVLSSPGDDVFPFRANWQPDGLSATVNGKLWTFGLSGNTERTEVPFTASVTLNRPTWTRKQRDYSNSSKQTLGIGAPALSHNGGRVAFTALGDLWQWNLVNDELTQLTDDRFAEATPVYAPNGKYIAYVSDRNGSSQLWLHNLTDGSQRLLDEKITGVSYPSWSPDGEHLAYFGSLLENPLGGQLVLNNLTQGNSRSVGLPIPPQPLSWSQDSQHIAVAALAPYSRRFREGVYELRVFSTTGKQITRINLERHRSPLDVRLTPDGQGIGYVQGGQLMYQRINSSFAKLGAPRRIGDTLADTPAWSGDGQTVLAIAGDNLRRFKVASGEQTSTLTVPLDYTRALNQGSWTLRTGRLFDGNGPAYQRDLDIVIKDNKIDSVTPHSDSNPQPVIDVTEHVVMPGLFEMHAHMGLLSEPQGRIWLAWGITSVRDPGSNPYLAKERQEAWDSGRRPGPRTHVTGYLADGTRVFYPIAEGLDDSTLQNALLRSAALELDFIKTYVRLPDHQQQRVINFAHANGMPVSSHELFPAAAIGSDHVEHIGGTSRRGYQPKVSSLGYSYNDVVELLAGSGMGITPTVVLPAWAVIFNEDKDLFATNQFKHFYGPAALKNYASFARRFGAGAKSQHHANSRLLNALVKRDALLVTGTDSPFVPYGPGLHAELRLYERAGLMPWQVLRAATVKSAQAAGVGAELGQIAPGMLADLVVVRGDPLATLKDADNVVLTVKGGRRFEIAELLR